MPDDDRAPLRTSIGEIPLDEYRLALAGREWRVLHTGAVLSHADEQRYLREGKDRLPYGARNGAPPIEYRLADWSQWDDADRYDVIVGSDVLYSEAMHPHLRAILDANLAPGGRVLLADPFRAASYALLESLEQGGWTVAMSKWTVGEDADPRAVGVFELTRPGADTAAGGPA